MQNCYNKHMIKIWFKLIIEDKIIKDVVYTLNEHFSEESFNFIVSEVCNMFDTPAPIILTKHINQFLNFNTTTFTKDDFVERFDYDKLVLENAYED